MSKTGRIITATLLTITTIGLVVFAVKKGIKPKALQTKADIQVTDLTDTIWYFNETPTPTTGVEEYTINFTVNGNTYTKLSISKSIFFQINGYGGINSSLQTFYSSMGGWYNQNFRTFEFTGGTDVTNTTLINYLYANATLTNYEDIIYNEGYQAGYTAGYTAGETAGYQTGYTAGETAGYQTGYTAGETAGFQTGYTAGETAGYTEGYNDSEAFNHPIALQPLMLNILTMPFTFISQAFDVTLWPGTDYEFNIANFIKGLIAIATVLFIIKMFTSGFSVIGNYTEKTTQSKVNRSQVKLNKAKTEKIKKETK